MPVELAHQFPAYMSYFVSGMVYMLYSDFFSKHERKLMIPFGLIFVFYCVTKSKYLMILEPFATTVVIMFLASHLRVFNSIGATHDYSFPMYLFHYPIILTMNSFGFFKEKPFVAIICVFAVSYLIAFLVTRIKELVLVLNKKEIQ